MGESTIDWAKRQKLSTAQKSCTNAVCEDCGRKWTATLTEVPVTIFIKDLDEYYKKISSNLLEAVEPPMVLCVFRPADRDIWDTEVTLSVVAPRQETPYHWRINHKFSGPAAVSGCQISIWKADQNSTSRNDDVSIEQNFVTIKEEVKEEPKEEEEDEVMFEDVSIDPFSGNRSYDPDDPEPDWTNSDTDTFKRFATASSAEIAKIRGDRHEANTKRATQWAVRVFQDWYTEKIENGEYDNLNWQNFPKEQLNKTLARFYVELRRRDGRHYSKQAYIGLRAGLQRHLNDDPWFLPYALTIDPAFKESNETMIGVIKMLARQGMDNVNHHKAMDPKDIEKLKTSNVIGTDNPLSLQRLVWFGITLHFGRRAREKYREMTRDSFVINMDSDGRRYLQQSNQVGKLSNVMYEQPNNEYCTFRAFEQYSSLINDDLDCLWQRPNMINFKETGIWYNKQVVGKHTMGAFLKNMCKDAGITAVYTNHCVRLTTGVLLNEAGFEENDIKKVTGHKTKLPNIMKRKVADTISNVLSEGKRKSSPSTSEKPTKLHVLVPNAQALSSVTHSMHSFDIDSCKEGSGSIYNSIDVTKEKSTDSARNFMNEGPSTFSTSSPDVTTKHIDPIEEHPVDELVQADLPNKHSIFETHVDEFNQSHTQT